MTESYTPSPGDQVRVRRYQVPTPELPGIAERKMIAEHTGTVVTVQPTAGGVLFRLEGDPEWPMFTGYQFTGQDPEHGCSWSLQTEVVPQADAWMHDLAEYAARVAEAEAGKARALALWERARDAEVVAKQRLKGAQERLEAILRDKP
jgi:hypothetical protein